MIQVGKMFSAICFLEAVSAQGECYTYTKLLLVIMLKYSNDAMAIPKLNLAATL